MTALAAPITLIALVAVTAGCGSRVAQTASRPDAIPNDAGLADAAIPVNCGSTLASRLAVTSFDVDEDIRYKREGYDIVATDARLAFHVAPSGNSYVAWTNDAFNAVHVTPLSALQTRLGPDIVIPGYDVGGLVAHDDGFALLLDQEDPGTPLLNLNPSDRPYGKAAVLLRYRSDVLAFTAPLTGTASIASTGAAALHDCAPERFDGRLAYQGGKYGAYFSVHGCEGDAHERYYADKLVYLDDRGQSMNGGWDWGCQLSQDMRLLPESDAFTALCIADRAGPSGGGMYLLHEGPTFTLLASDFAKGNFCSSQFGSIIKLTDGSYVIVWLSRGGTGPDGTSPTRPANDIALLHLSAAPEYTPGSIIWVSNTPSIHEANLHVARYGTDRILIAWDSVENFDCSQNPNAVTCLGDYTGTHFRLVDPNGKYLSEDEILPAPPNSRDEMVTFPNGDVGWAFVPDAQRSYSDYLRLDAANVPLVAAQRTISIARLLYCP